MLVASLQETTIITTIHHIISDGWSIGIFQRELAALYQEELGGRPASLPELPIQYADYVIWQRERLEGEGLDRLKQYWSRELEGVAHGNRNSERLSASLEADIYRRCLHV